MCNFITWIIWWWRQTSLASIGHFTWIMSDKKHFLLRTRFGFLLLSSEESLKHVSSLHLVLGKKEGPRKWKLHGLHGIRRLTPCVTELVRCWSFILLFQVFFSIIFFYQVYPVLDVVDSMNLWEFNCNWCISTVGWSDRPLEWGLGICPNATCPKELKNCLQFPLLTVHCVK